MNDTIVSRYVTNGVEVTRKSNLSGKTHTRTMTISHDDWIKGMDLWNRQGKYIQDAFPMLDANDREFLLTGATPKEWDELFGDES